MQGIFFAKRGSKYMQRSDNFEKEGSAKAVEVTFSNESQYKQGK